MILDLLRWFIHYLIIKPFRNLIPGLSKQWDFEERNWSFVPTFQGNADYCFEVSSEGELEQIRPILMNLFSLGKKIELLYCSMSVEKNIRQLQKEFQSQLHTLRVPLLQYYPGAPAVFNIHKWITAPILILCRYDFFPEFFQWAAPPTRSIALVSATSLRLEEKLSHWLLGRWYKKAWNSFKWVVPSTRDDERKLKLLLGDKCFSHFDFRLLGITDRQRQAPQTFQQKIPQYQSLLFLLNNYPIQNRFVIGSAWSEDLQVFSNFSLSQSILKGEIFFAVVPHVVGPQTLIEMRNKFPKIPVYEWRAGMSEEDVEDLVNHWQERPGILVINLKGILCELYTEFGHAIVGGGFGKSVHSLLEPYLANCHVYCGPAIKRSTEFIFIQSEHPQRIHVLQNQANLGRDWDKNLPLNKDEILHLENRFKVQWDSMCQQLGWSKNAQ